MKMKRTKLLALLLCALMVLSLAACGSFEMKMARAAQKMEKLQSYRTDIKVDLGMSMSLLGQSLPLEPFLTPPGVRTSNPFRLSPTWCSARLAHDTFSCRDS